MMILFLRQRCASVISVSLSCIWKILRNIVQVYRRPKIAVASTGDELVDPKDGSRLGKGQVRFIIFFVVSNRYFFDS